VGEIFNLGRSTSRRRSPAPLAGPRGPSASGSFDALALLLAETATGREASFARLYELTAGQLFAVARRMVGGRNDVAEDVLQDSFVRIGRWAHRYDSEKGTAYGWLLQIVRNRALTARDALHRREALLQREDGRDEIQGDALASLEADPADQAVRSEDARRVNACLASLAENHRRALTLAFFEGLTHGELAERLDVPLGTAKSWVRRGLAQMNRCLTGDADAGWRELVAAGYAVGTLRGAARLGFERRRARDARYCRAVDQWEERFALLAEMLAPAPLRPRVWQNIERQIAPGRVPAARRTLWRTAGVVLAVAIVLLAIILLAVLLR
jgi:RNA polymerase sigma-70 factor (ECF subfamily)